MIRVRTNRLGPSLTYVLRGMSVALEVFGSLDLEESVGNRIGRDAIKSVGLHRLASKSQVFSSQSISVLSLNMAKSAESPSSM